MKNCYCRFVTAFLALILTCSCSKLEIDRGAMATGELPFVPLLADSGPALVLNGVPIEDEEIRIIALQQEKETVDEFMRKHHAVVGEGFWEHSFEGEVPIEHLEKWTVYRMVWTRLAQEMSVEQGLRDAFGLADKQAMMEEENRVRLEMKEKGETVYGPEQYTLAEFYTIDEQSLELALIQTLESKEILRDEGRGRDRRINRIERMKMAFRQLIEQEMSSCEVKVNRTALRDLIQPSEAVE